MSSGVVADTLEKDNTEKLVSASKKITRKEEKYKISVWCAMKIIVVVIRSISSTKYDRDRHRNLRYKKTLCNELFIIDFLEFRKL